MVMLLPPLQQRHHKYRNILQETQDWGIWGLIRIWIIEVWSGSSFSLGSDLEPIFSEGSLRIHFFLQGRIRIQFCLEGRIWLIADRIRNTSKFEGWRNWLNKDLNCLDKTLLSTCHEWRLHELISPTFGYYLRKKNKKKTEWIYVKYCLTIGFQRKMYWSI